MAEIVLDGCRAEPLASYLKAVGVMRLVAEQLDAGVTGWWHQDAFHIDTSFTLDEIVDFLAERYEPSPIVSPWNGGSGLAPGDEKSSKKSFEAVALLAASTSSRLEAFGAAVAAARALTARADWQALDKSQQGQLCRNTFPDRGLRWIDTAVVLAGNRAVFPAMLGTGGNDGRLDFGGNFAQRIVEALGVGAKPPRRELVRAQAVDALTGRADEALSSISLGQFSPAAAGGPGSSPSGSADGVGNPWDFILMFEGVALFASAVARRFGADANHAAVPFSVSARSVGYSTSAGEKARSEFWAPLWFRPATLGELERLAGEGRMYARGAQAADPLAAARAVADLGVDRGISSFVRFGFVERNGLAFMAIPVGRFDVADRPRAAVGLLGEVDRWVGRFRSVKNGPASLSASVRRVEELQLRLSVETAANAIQDLLVGLAELDALRRRSRAVGEHIGDARPRLPAAPWLALADDDTAEFDFARALASLRRSSQRTGLVATQLFGLDGRPVVGGFGRRPLDAVLADVLAGLLVSEIPRNRGDDTGCFGPALAVPARLSTLEAFLDYAIDDGRASNLLGALMMLDWREAHSSPHIPERSPALGLPTAYAVLKPTWHHRAVREARRPMRGATRSARQLIAGAALAPLELALRELRLAGYAPAVHSSDAIARTMSARRVAAACLVPISDRDVAAITARIARRSVSESQEQP